MQKYTVAVAGATGYAGAEVLRILAMHPAYEITCVAGHSSAGQSMQVHTPHIPQVAHMVVEDTTAEVLSNHDIVFLALPHGASGEIASHLHDVKVVVDLGADHRLENKTDWDTFYGGDFYEHWSYGMPELIVGTKDDGSLSFQRDNLKGANFIAGPGCNVTATTLAFQPAIASGLVSYDITANLVVGYSGAGKSTGKINLLASQALGSAQAYSVGGTHRHIPEVKQNFAHAAGMAIEDASQFNLGFTPVLAPMSRGILAVVSAAMTDKARAMSDEEIREVYQKAYDDQDFMVLLPEGMLPATADVVGSNAAHLQVVPDRNSGLLYAFCAIDNLNRGTAGQAVQSLNIALGLPENIGLTKIGVAP